MTRRYDSDRKARTEAAKLLDATHVMEDRGPRTIAARRRLATVLDLGFTPRRADLAWLRRILGEKNRTP